MARRTCAGTTKKGRPCGNYPLRGGLLCRHCARGAEIGPPRLFNPPEPFTFNPQAVGRPEEWARWLLADGFCLEGVGSARFVSMYTTGEAGEVTIQGAVVEGGQVVPAAGAPKVTLQQWEVCETIGATNGVLGPTIISILMRALTAGRPVYCRTDALREEARELFSRVTLTFGEETISGAEALEYFTPGPPPWEAPGLPAFIAPAPSVPPSATELTVIPRSVPQATFQEVKTLTRALTDGPDLAGWSPIIGELAWRHTIENNPFQTKLSEGPYLDWWGLPLTLESVGSQVRQLEFSAVLLYHVCMGLLLEQREVTVSIDELMRGIGWEPRSVSERAEARRRLWRWLLIFDSLSVIGRRPGRYKDPRTKELIDLVSFDAFLKVTGYRVPAPALDGSVPPLDVTLVAGPWINQHRGDRRILSTFGEVRRIAQIPAGRTPGAWAQSIGLALNQQWRERAARAEIAHVGDDNHPTARFDRPFTRRSLLEQFHCRPDCRAAVILSGPNPKRAQTYWHEAIKQLKDVGVVSSYREVEPLPDSRRKSWQDAWLDQPLDIRPAAEGVQAVAAIARGAKNARRRRKRECKAS